MPRGCVEFVVGAKERGADSLCTGDRFGIVNVEEPPAGLAEAGPLASAACAVENEDALPAVVRGNPGCEAPVPAECGRLLWPPSLVGGANIDEVVLTGCKVGRCCDGDEWGGASGEGADGRRCRSSSAGDGTAGRISSLVTGTGLCGKSVVAARLRGPPAPDDRCAECS